MLGLLGAIGHPQPQARAGHRPRHRQHRRLARRRSRRWSAWTWSSSSRWSSRSRRASEPVNHDVLANPKVHVTIGDARETLLTSRDRYDVIASEPSNPYRAGIASLFTLEYYRAASARLTEDGVFAQWVQAYEIDAPTLRTIYATMAAVFPQVETWQTSQRRSRADRHGAAAQLQCGGAARPHRRGAVQVGARQRLARRGHQRRAGAFSRHRRLDPGVCRGAARRDQHRRPQRRRVRPGALGRPLRSRPGRGYPRAGAGDGRVAPAARQRRRHRVARGPDRLGELRRVGRSDGRHAGGVRRRRSCGRRHCGATTRPATWPQRWRPGPESRSRRAIRRSWRWPPTWRRKRARTRRCP